MKTISRLLSLILSDMKSEDIYVLLIFITLFFKVVWVAVADFFRHAVKTFTEQHHWSQSRLTNGLSLCH